MVMKRNKINQILFECDDQIVNLVMLGGTAGDHNDRNVGKKLSIT
jgi:hypothetical protein